jgi:RNA polymerase sigma factor (sigma-70 family)
VPSRLPDVLAEHPLAASLELPEGFDLGKDADLEALAAQLLRRFRTEHDGEAFELLVALTRRRLLAIARRLTRSPPVDAEDLLARFLARLFTEVRPDEPDVPHFLGLAVTTMRYDLLNLQRQAIRRRKRGRRWQQAQWQLDEPADPSDVACRRERGAHLPRVASTLLSVVIVAFRDLPERDRDVLLRRELEHLSYDDLAVSTGVPRTQVGMVLQRARRKLVARIQTTLGDALPAVALAAHTEHQTAPRFGAHTEALR